MRNTIIVDVDQTVVNTGKTWFEWLMERSNKSDVLLEERIDSLKYMTSLDDSASYPFRFDYDMGKYFPEVESPHDFWEMSTLYDDLVPMKSAVKTLSMLSELGHSIIFVSYCKDGHYGSKRKFINKHFPFHRGFVATKDKHLVSGDIIIDDRLEFAMNHPCKRRIVKTTAYTQGMYEPVMTRLMREKYIPEYKLHLCDNWDAIGFLAMQ